MTAEPACEFGFIGWLGDRRLEILRRRRWVERDLRAHNVVVHRTNRGGRQVFVVSRGIVALRRERLATPVQRLRRYRRRRTATEQVIPRRYRTAQIAAHVARQTAPERAGHARIAGRKGCDQTVEDVLGTGVVTQLFLRFPGFEQRHRRKVIVGDVAGKLQELDGRVRRGRGQGMVVTRFDGAVTVGIGREICLEIGARPTKIPEQVADDPGVKAVLRSHAAELVKQVNRLRRFARSWELRDRGAQGADRVIGPAELARAYGQVVQLLAHVALRASRGQQLAIGLHGGIRLIQRDFGSAEVFGQVDLEQARLGDVEALLAVGGSLVGTVGGQPHIFELEADRGRDERIGIGNGPHFDGGFVPALQSAQGLAFEQPRRGVEIGAGCGADQERLTRRQGEVELSVADQRLTVDQAYLGLLLTTQVFDQGFQETDGSREVAAGEGGVAVADKLRLIGWQATEHGCGQHRQTGRRRPGRHRLTRGAAGRGRGGDLSGGIGDGVRGGDPCSVNSRGERLRDHRVRGGLGRWRCRLASARTQDRQCGQNRQCASANTHRDLTRVVVHRRRAGKNAPQ